MARLEISPTLKMFGPLSFASSKSQILPEFLILGDVYQLFTRQKQYQDTSNSQAVERPHTHTITHQTHTQSSLSIIPYNPSPALTVHLQILTKESRST